MVRVFNGDGSIPDDGLQAVIEPAAKEAKITRQVSAGEVADLILVRDDDTASVSHRRPMRSMSEA